MSNVRKPTKTRPSSIPPKGTKQRVKPASLKGSIPEEARPKKGLEWTRPAYSVCPKSKKGLDWDKIQKDVIRRQAPQGEDLKQIKRALKELQGKKIPVHDFITLVSPYTADNGAEFRSVLTEDIEYFQTMARKVYESMARDISDVLMNDQIDTVQYYEEKHNMMTEKMMRAINEIYAIIPDFDIEKYLKLKDVYLESMIPLPEKIVRDKEDEEMRKKQETYHRLQWLRNEGSRMSEENQRLQARLNQLKSQQQTEEATAKEEQAILEAQRIQLEKQESQMRNQLDQLNEDVERSIIESEQQEVKSSNEKSFVAEQKSSTQIRKVGKGVKSKKKPEWATVTAQEMENTAAQEAIASESAALHTTPNIRLSTPTATSTVNETANVTTRSRRQAPPSRPPPRQRLAPKDTRRGL